MEIVVPMWFKQRQAIAEQAGENMLRLTGPNLAEGFILIRQEPDRNQWTAALRLARHGPDVAIARAAASRPYEAWEAAFELYRSHIVV